jgi:hypothetical protein
MLCTNLYFPLCWHTYHSPQSPRLCVKLLCLIRVLDSSGSAPWFLYHFRITKYREMGEMLLVDEGSNSSRSIIQQNYLSQSRVTCNPEMVYESGPRGWRIKAAIKQNQYLQDLGDWSDNNITTTNVFENSIIFPFYKLWRLTHGFTITDDLVAYWHCFLMSEIVLFFPAKWQLHFICHCHEINITEMLVCSCKLNKVAGLDHCENLK